MNNNNLNKFSQDEFDVSNMVYEADAFFEAADLCSKNNLYKMNLTDPNIVNKAFAGELYLKAILVKNGISIEHFHNLLELFHLLPDEQVEKVAEGLVYLTNPVFCPPSRDLLEQRIDEMANAFVEWRYAYEYKKLSIDLLFLDAFVKCLHEIVEPLRMKQCPKDAK